MPPITEFVWILAILCIVGVVLWGLSQIPIDGTIKAIIRVVIIVVAVIYLVYFIAGLITGLPPLPRGR